MSAGFQTRAGIGLTACSVAALLLLGGCDKPPVAVPAAPEVGVVTLRSQAVTITSELPGRTDAWRVAEVRPQVSGVIEKRLFTEGSDVKQGQQLYQIDDAPYRAAYDKAAAALTTAQHLAERDGKLLADNAVSKQQYDDAMSAWRQAQADVESARINLAYTKVYAPISGRIGRSAVTEGALVTNGQGEALAVVQQIDPIYVDVTQSSIDLMRLRRELAQGQLSRSGEDAASVGLVLEDGTTYGQQGSLKFSEVSVDQGTGSVLLRAVFRNPDHHLLPGMFVHARLNEGTKADAILVPQQGVTRDTTGAPQVWVVGPDSKATLRPIQVDRTVGNTWLATSGVRAGERVVTEGLQRLQPGVKVSAQPATNVQVQTGEDTSLPDAALAPASDSTGS
ncbi:efflux transporter periplasmic adaptor subunit [Paraburkholderia steynii]|uniref:Efflux transporter periplasmic adaptor subunit n=1 Tax=Paraburkholderia steynii TaxID=1245441 RepID=A0A4R0X4M0_9BURK|nr:efflux transporter periplasmic adaptor subunit [Paraburkholderia steynii]